MLFFFALPVLAYNYILYEQKGITDVIFTRFLKTSPEIYASLQGFDKDFDIAYLFTDGIPFLIYSSFFMLDPFITAFGLLGLVIILFSPQYRPLRFFLCFFIPSFIFLLGTSLLQTHFVPYMMPLALCAALAIDSLAGILERKAPLSYPRVILLALLLIGSLFLLAPYLHSTSAQFELRSYVTESTKEKDVILVDPRIYGGRIAWTFNDRLYAHSFQFLEIVNMLANTTVSNIPRTVYYVECVPDDCGWGTIAQQPEFNASVEQVGRGIIQQMELVHTIVGGGGYGEQEGKPYFKVYKGGATLDIRIDESIRQTHTWFYYPVQWALPNWYDKYTPEGLFQSSLHFSGVLALWCAVLCALIAPFFLLREFITQV